MRGAVPKGIPRRERWCRRPLTKGKDRGADGLDDGNDLEMEERDEGSVILLIIVYYLDIGSVSQSDLSMEDGFESRQIHRIG